MKRLLFIGQLNHGSTCSARLAALRDLLPSWEIVALDTWKGMEAQPRLFRTLAWRWRVGPAVDAENRLIRDAVLARAGSFDLTWIDKGVFIRPSTLNQLRARTRTLLHYTPDTAFLANRSRLFERGMPLYDLLVTTKTFELDRYIQYVPEDKALLVTQGYDKLTHYPRPRGSGKSPHAVFVGLAEPHREAGVRALLNAGVRVAIAGQGWSRFLSRNAGPLLESLGASLWKDAYAEALSNASVGLGFLSRYFPERHTTRTFEIPACGAVLATERTSETESFFAPDAALFYSGTDELVARVLSCLRDSRFAEAMARRGRQTVEAGPYSYHAITERILRVLRVEQ